MVLHIGKGVEINDLLQVPNKRELNIEMKYFLEHFGRKCLL